jgi:hypothetical protein
VVGNRHEACDGMGSGGQGNEVWMNGGELVGLGF